MQCGGCAGEGCECDQRGTGKVFQPGFGFKVLGVPIRQHGGEDYREARGNAGEDCGGDHE